MAWIHMVSAWLTGLTVALAVGLVVMLAPWPMTVIDGDTVDRWPWHYRLTGYDAAEIRRARRPAEREAGLAAKARLAELIAGAQRGDLLRLRSVSDHSTTDAPS